MTKRRFLLFPLFTLMVLLMVPATASAGAFWFRAAGGVADMAMEDINDQDFGWYEDSPAGFDMPDVGTGFFFDLAVGGDIQPGLAAGFHWDRQYAGTEGNDQGVEGNLNLNASFFMARVEWRPVRKDKIFAGLSGGMGPFSTTGNARVQQGSVDYGKQELSGSSWAFDTAALFDYKMGKNSYLHVAAGYRWAKIDEFKVGGRPALKDDDTFMALDYTGWTLRAGVTWVFKGAH